MAVSRRFQTCMSVALEEMGVDYGEFNRSRGYRDFRMDIEDMDDPLNIAAHAVSFLCNGSRGAMDQAVAIAVCEYLQTEAGVVIGEDALLAAVPVTTDQALQILTTGYS